MSEPNDMEKKIRRMYHTDVAMLVFLEVILIIVLAFVLFVVLSMVPNTGSRIIAIGTASVLVIASSITVFAVYTHLKKNHVETNREDIEQSILLKSTDK